MEAARRRATDRLHEGRVSVSGATYFVTFVTEDRAPWLASPKAAAAMLGALRVWHGEGDGSIRAATVMPDHVHVLFALGERLDVGRCVSRWKATGRKMAGFAGGWQRDFWERRLRDSAEEEEYALYIFLNPHRDGLVPRDASWPGWWAPEPARFRFSAMLEAEGGPPEKWFVRAETRFAGLETGE